MWCSMDVCEILKSVLGLEMSVHESLLNVHKCAVDGPISEDPHVNIEKYYIIYWFIFFI